MPIYDYKCQQCGKINEIFQRTAADKEITCSSCGSDNMEKLLSAPGAILTGSSTPEGTTCCGREERCETPPCSTVGSCKRDR